MKSLPSPFTLLPLFLGVSMISAQAAAPVAVGDILLVEEGSSVTTDYLLSNDSDADGDALTITATSTPTNGVVTDNGGGSYTYTPTGGFTGDDSFTYDVSDGSTTVQATVHVSVNAAINATTTRDDILAGVTTLADPGSPGHMTAWGPTAVIVSNYSGQDETRPMFVAGTMGSGRVVAMGDHQWLIMDNYGGSENTGTFYLNTMTWLAGTTDKTIKVVTLNANSSTFLTSNGFTNVVTATSGTVVAELATADVFMGWMGSNPSQAIQDAVEDFTKGGGGLFLCDYGIGYSWWWGKATEDIPGNRVLRDAGIGFTKTWPNGGVQTINRATREITDDDVVAVIQNPGSYTQGEKDRAAAIYEQMNEVLPDDDTLQARLDLVYATKVASLNPTPTTPITDSLEKAMLTQEANLLKDLPVSEVTAHRTADAVYGPVTSGARVTQIVNVDTSKPRWHSTGLYAAAGETLTLTVPVSVIAAGYKVRLSGHVDNISSRSSWDRVPFGTSRAFDLDATTVQVASAFGGALYIDTGTATGTTPSFNVTVQNAVEAPYFVLGTTTNAQWVAGIRDNPAPYAELVSDHVILSLPSSFIRAIDDMEAIMTYWDQAVARQDYIGGMDHIRANQMAERINVDVQISVGLLHAGYPIQGPTWASGGLVNYQQMITSGDWGYFHELGHESQRRPDKYWGGWDNPYTFPGDVEVTVNIFANASLELLAPDTGTGGWGYSAHPDEVMRKSLTEVAKGGTFDSKSPYPFYFQLADGFDWGMYRAVFQTYHDDVLNNPSALPTTGAEEKDQWLVRWSQTAGVSMKKFMVDEWGLTVSASALSQISALPDWLPVTGGLRRASVLGGSSVILDLAGEALSYDGVATISNVTQGTHGTVSDNGDGTWTYTPDPGHTGDDSISYDVTSSTGHSFTTIVKLSVNHGAWLERWDGIAGNEITILTGDPRYPDSPTHTSVLENFDTGQNLADSYGARMRAWLVAPATGNFTFWIASDDNGELHLSTDADPANTQLIGNVPGYTNYKSWDADPNQESSPIALVAGQHYYIEALVKEGGGGDHLAVAWSGPGFSRKDLTSEALVLTSNSAPTADDDTFAIDEDASVSSPVGSVTATDPNPLDTLSYAITAGNTGGAFDIDSDGDITTATALDHETTDQYVLTVTATDDGSPQESNTATITVNVGDVNEAPTASDDTFAIDEGALISSPVGSVSASDPDDGDTLSYAITAGNTGGAFDIDSDGDITTATALDHETTDQYVLTVTVTDNGSPQKGDTATITINVGDVSGDDSDGDSLGDSWEVTHFGDTTSQDGDGDPDGDGLNNRGEFALDSDPNSGAASRKVMSKVADVVGTKRLTLTLPVRGTPAFAGAGPGLSARASAPVDGLIYRIEASRDLDFSGANVSTVEEVTPAISAGLPVLNPGWSYRTFRTDSNVAVDSSDFIRIVIEEAP